MDTRTIPKRNITLSVTLPAILFYPASQSYWYYLFIYALKIANNQLSFKYSNKVHYIYELVLSSNESMIWFINIIVEKAVKIRLKELFLHFLSFSFFFELLCYSHRMNVIAYYIKRNLMNRWNIANFSNVRRYLRAN